MIDLNLLDAEYVGFDPMDLVRAVPGVLQQTGTAIAKKPAAQDDDKKAPAKTAAPASEGIGLGWKIGGGAVALIVLLRLLKR